MTSSLPDPDADRPDPLHGASDEEVNRRFAELVAGFDEPDQPWAQLPSTTAPENRATATSATGSTTPAEPERANEPAADWIDPATERARRRELRRLEREAEYQFFLEQRAQEKAERDADQEHYTPPEPPPIPRPGRRTVGALLLLALGLFLLLWPDLLPAAADLVTVVGVLFFLAGSTMLFLGLRKHSGDPDNGEGWDDGAEL